MLRVPRQLFLCVRTPPAMAGQSLCGLRFSGGLRKPSCSSRKACAIAFVLVGSASPEATNHRWSVVFKRPLTADGDTCGSRAVGAEHVQTFLLLSFHTLHRMTALSIALCAGFHASPRGDGSGQEDARTSHPDSMPFARRDRGSCGGPGAHPWGILGEACITLALLLTPTVA